MLFFIAVWYGTGDTSALKKYYPLALDKLLGSSITLNEALLVFVLFPGMALLLSQCKLSIPRSRLHTPVIIFFITFLLPYLRMTYDEGTFRIPYEIHDLTFFVAYLCVFLIFRAEEYKKLFVGLLIIALLKAIEGCIGYIIQPTAHSSWGALTEWRDGYLMGIALTTWLVVITLKDDIPRKKVQQATIGALIILISFIISIRRSFIFALPFASIATILALRGNA
ncbi:MAG TPA: hypothetical protein VFJ29_02220, partial [Candidatus Kapabacteria bacterium]|nr:hypothetical protein [Candidatus Kapabacteria bacterium]